MSTAANARKVLSLTYDSACTEPVGAHFQTRATIRANKPGIIITDECLAIEDIQHMFTFKFQGLKTMPTPGALASAVAVLQSFANSTGGSGGSNLTVTLPNSMFYEGDIDAPNDVAVQTISGRYVGTSLQPMTVA